MILSATLYPLLGHVCVYLLCCSLNDSTATPNFSIYIGRVNYHNSTGRLYVMCIVTLF
ncbi:hypothetical protein M758_7G012000 [Ceratodon purpureus]|uniref:Uncharacterized protein n=1 Tax=Ceratodon purpureus TaxID=3225 RepID=A0A8T0H644_CERPU|nr:hypothetical protein KC19_7G011800 [Ceratodon purpureus]KAG0609760.1 hypothetical protein M758_7G012000 [Ceratodon purpureus]